MNLRKISAMAITSVLAVGMLAGCGSSSDNSGSSSAPAESAAAEGSASAAEEGSAAAEGKTYTVGICQLVQHPALDAATQGFRAAIDEALGEGTVTFDEQNAAGESAQCATICNTFASNKYDLIMANATAALQAAAAATGDIPILATSITDYASALELSDFSGTTGKNISGTSDLAPLDQQAEMLHDLFPDAKNVGIIYCSAEPNSKFQADNIRTYLEGFGYTVTDFTFADSNDVASIVQSACDASDVLYVPTDNTAANCAENINNVAIPAKTPIVAGEEGICAGCGIVTLSIDYYDLGYETGKMAVEILTNGADPSTMEIQYAAATTKKYNAANCEALGITVPDDYVAIEG